MNGDDRGRIESEGNDSNPVLEFPELYMSPEFSSKILEDKTNPEEFKKLRPDLFPQDTVEDHAPENDTPKYEESSEQVDTSSSEEIEVKHREEDSGLEEKREKRKKAYRRVGSGIMLGGILSQAAGSGVVIADTQKEREKKEDNVASVREQYHEDITKESTGDKQGFSFLDSSIGSGLDSEGLVKESVETGERDVVQEIKEIIDDINNQSLEDRVNSKLTVDAGLIDFLSKEFSEIGIPTFHYSNLEGDIYSQNRQTKLEVEGMTINELSGRFSIPGEEIDKESILIRKAQKGWNDAVLTYGGNITVDFLQKGDVISILDRDIISEQISQEVKNNLDKDVKGVHLGAIIDKQTTEEGEEVLTIAFSDNEERSIKTLEINSENIQDILGENIFVTRKDWEGLDPQIFDFLSWEEGYKIVQPQFNGYVEVADSGVKLYTLDLHSDGYMDKQGEVKEILVPPGFKLNIRHGFGIERPDGSGVRLGFPDLEFKNWPTKFNSVAVLGAWDSDGNEVSFVRKMGDKYDTKKSGFEWYRMHSGYTTQIKKRSQIGWNTPGDLPFYMAKYSSMQEFMTFTNYFYSKENFENAMVYELIQSDPIINEVKDLQETLNAYSSELGVPLSQYLKESSWYRDYVNRRSEEDNLNAQGLEDIEQALGYISSPPITGIPFQMAMSILYPELHIQSVGAATVTGEDGLTRGAMTALELIPQELRENPWQTQALSGYGGIVFKGVPYLGFLKKGDTIISSNGLSIVLGEQGHPEFPYVGGKSIYPIIEANRYGNGDIFLGVINEENQAVHIGGWAGEVYVLRGIE